jgi:hypothetical protein
LGKHTLSDQLQNQIPAQHVLGGYHCLATREGREHIFQQCALVHFLFFLLLLLMLLQLLLLLSLV